MVARPSAPAEINSRITVPQWDKDPIWSLRSWPVVLEAQGHELVVPAMPAADWLAVLMSPHLSVDTLLDLILGWEEAMVEIDYTMEDWAELCLDMISTVSARPWWITLRLVHYVRASWDSIGEQLVTKMDAERVSLAAWLNVALITILREMDPKKVAMFIAQMEQPPAGVEVPAEELEMSAEQFRALAA